MRNRRGWILLGTMLSIVWSIAGCSSEAEKKTSPAPVKREATTTAAPADKSRTEKPESQPEEPAATSETSAADKSSSGSKSVLLGSPELTAGIPGEGPLTMAQITAWLDQPANHDTLDVVLPMGLDAGKIPAGVLESNPLTRAKVELGRQLYFDVRLSADGTVSCASCHHPDEGFARHTRFGVGIRNQEGNRNSPMSYNRILSLNQFWDGRAASLEEQAVGPIANPIEMGNTHEQAVETVKGIDGYRLQFARVFGEEGVTIGNIGKAIAAFERVLVTGPSPADYHEKLFPFLKLTNEDFEDDPDLAKEFAARQADTKAHPMSESAIRGRDLFFSQRINCARCHVGANFSDEKYHNLGIGMDQPEPDLGRYNVTKQDVDRGAFKTPTIRNIALSAPYMHDGSLKTLEEVVEHYNKGGIPNKFLSTNIIKLNLKDQEKQDLVAYMEACSGEFPKVERGRLP